MATCIGRAKPATQKIPQAEQHISTLYQSVCFCSTHWLQAISRSLVNGRRNYCHNLIQTTQSKWTTIQPPDLYLFDSWKKNRRSRI